MFRGLFQEKWVRRAQTNRKSDLEGHMQIKNGEGDSFSIEKRNTASDSKIPIGRIIRHKCIYVTSSRGGCTPRATRAMARGSAQKIAEEV